MSIETVLTEIAALRSEVKSLSKICRKLNLNKMTRLGKRQLLALRIMVLTANKLFPKNLESFSG